MAHEESHERLKVRGSRRKVRNIGTTPNGVWGCGKNNKTMDRIKPARARAGKKQTSGPNHTTDVNDRKVTNQ